MISLHRPTSAEIDVYLASIRDQPYSYPEVGATRDEVPPPNYAIDHRRILVGKGERAFQVACDCLRRWDMFQLGWLVPCWPHTPLEPGSIMATLVRLFCTSWVNPCRIVYVEEPTEEVRRFRFAYGTLLDHVEMGEERFTVEWLDDDTVWYDLYAFSRPHHWLAKVGYPAVRWLQKRGGGQSMPVFARAVRKGLAFQRREVVA